MGERAAAMVLGCRGRSVRASAAVARPAGCASFTALAAVAAVAAVVAPRSAAAAGPRRILAVARIVPSSNALGLQPILESAAEVMARSPDLSVIPPLAPETAELAGALRESLSDPRAFSRRLHAAGIDLGLVVIANFSVAPAILSVQLVTDDESRPPAETFEAFDPNDPGALMAAVGALSVQVLESAGCAVGGRILVSVSPPTAAVWLDGEARTAPPLRVESGAATRAIAAVPGPHELRASLDGYEAATQTVVVVKEHDVTLSVALLERQSVFASPWLWIAVGAAVLGGGAIAYGVAHRSDAPSLVPGSSGKVILTLEP
jgi:hypothetical protein